jgi:hypothetical protein
MWNNLNIYVFVKIFFTREDEVKTTLGVLDGGGSSSLTVFAGCMFFLV